MTTIRKSDGTPFGTGETPELNFLIKDPAKALVVLTGYTVTMDLYAGMSPRSIKLWTRAATVAADQNASKGLATLQLAASDTAVPGEHYYEVIARSGSTINALVDKGIFPLERSGA